MQGEEREGDIHVGTRDPVHLVRTWANTIGDSLGGKIGGKAHIEPRGVRRNA